MIILILIHVSFTLSRKYTFLNSYYKKKIFISLVFRTIKTTLINVWKDHRHILVEILKEN